MRVTLTQPISVDEVDAEIVVVDGCALGFVSPGQAPHVLHVDPGEPAKFGVQSDDLLLSIDGQETASLSQEKVAALLRSASCLVFKRPESAVPEGKDEDTEPPSDEEKRAPSAPQAAGKERSRSRRGRRHRESKQERPREEAAAYPPGQPPFWAVERGPAWPVPGLRGPPSAWMGNAPPPWHVQPGPPPGGYPPRPPPETWRGPFPGPPPSQPPPRKGSLRLERNEGGGVSVVVMQVPPSLNKMDVLNEYFGRFGPVSSLQINQMRHEAIVTFSRMEDAEEALRFPVLNDPSIGLRPWRAKAGQRAPDDVPTETAPMAHSLVVPSVPLVASGNMTLESGKILEAKRKREELQDRRKALLSSLTDQLKAVLARINDPATSDRNREQLQTILASIKDKIHSLTPAEREDPKRRMPPMRPMTYQTTLDNRPRPAVLQLSKLPEEMRGPDGEAQLRDALGDSVEWIREWSEDGSACTVRFRDRRHAEAAVRDQQVWTWSAKIQEVMPFRRKPPVNRFTQPRHMHKVFRPPRAAEPAAGSDTEAFDSDIEDPELLASMRLPDPEIEPQAELAAEVTEAPTLSAEVPKPAEPAEPLAPAEPAQPSTEPLAVPAEAEAAAPPEAEPTLPAAAEAPAEPMAEEPTEALAAPESAPAEAPAEVLQATEAPDTEAVPADPAEPEAAPAPAAVPPPPTAAAAPAPSAEAPPAEPEAQPAPKAPEAPKATESTTSKAKADAKAKAKAKSAKSKAKAKATAAKASTRGGGRGRS